MSKSLIKNFFILLKLFYILNGSKYYWFRTWWMISTSATKCEVSKTVCCMRATPMVILCFIRRLFHRSTTVRFCEAMGWADEAALIFSGYANVGLIKTWWMGRGYTYRNWKTWPYRLNFDETSFIKWWDINHGKYSKLSQY